MAMPKSVVKPNNIPGQMNGVGVPVGANQYGSMSSIQRLSIAPKPGKIK